MRFQPVRHMVWAKTHQIAHPVRLNLSTSAMDPPTESDLGGPLPELPLTAASDGYNHPPFAARIAERYGVPEDRVQSTNGSSFANFLVGAACLQRGDRVVLERPVYEPLLRIAEAMEAEPVFVQRRMEDGWALDPDAVAKACGKKAALVVLTNLHNPSGAAMSSDTVKAAARAAERAEAMLHVDEVYLDSAFLVNPPPAPAATLAPNAVSTASWTKSYGAGAVRSGWIVGPADLIARIKMMRDTIDVHNPAPSDVVSMRCWEHRETLLKRSRRRFEENWPIVAAWLKRHPDWRHTSPAGGFVCFPRVPDHIEVPRLLARLMEKHGCAVTPGEFFGEPQHIRIGFGGECAMLEAGLAAIDEEAKACGA